MHELEGKNKIKNKHLKKAKNDQRIYDLINRERHPSDKTYCSNKRNKKKKKRKGPPNTDNSTTSGLYMFCSSPAI